MRVNYTFLNRTWIFTLTFILEFKFKLKPTTLEFVKFQPKPNAIMSISLSQLEPNNTRIGLFAPTRYACRTLLLVTFHRERINLIK